MEYRHQQQIQKDVGKAAGDQEIQRPLGVANGSEDARTHIIKQVWNGPYKIDAQIDHGMAHHIVRGLHGP